MKTDCKRDSIQMENYIIIRAGVDGGKTTTCGQLFEELRKKSEFSRLFDLGFNEIFNFEYDENGNLLDFIGVIIINGKVIVIISQGDIAYNLKVILDKLRNVELIKRISNYSSTSIDILIVTGRSQMRRNSTIEMLYNRVPADQRKEFWTLKSETIKDKNKIKEKVVTEIIEYIEQNNYFR